MKRGIGFVFVLIAVTAIFSSCGTLEKASTHGFNSGYYRMQQGDDKKQDVYVDISDESMNVHRVTDEIPDKEVFMAVSFKPADSVVVQPVVFTKKSLDIDITAVLLKYRPAVHGLPGQLTTDFNVALYAGWRHDHYKVKSKRDPLGKGYHKVSGWGYDFGVFAGPGGTLISPFTTQNQRSDEYNGLIIQTGVAGFIESNIASFGIGVGIDYLMNSDRDIWIYTNKPWVGFIVGFALN